MLKKYAIACLIGICALLCLSGCGQPVQTHGEARSTKPKPTPTPTPVPVIETPIHISIPSIGVNAVVEPVGILATGNLDTPHTNPWDSTGWYDHGVRPGDVGSAVIDGHVDRPGGGPAVFWNLQYMKVGEEITITTGSGQALHFYVTQRVAYPASEAPLQTIFGNTSGTHLNLITCAGDWIPSEGQTAARMVVFADLGQS
jgi:sortase (surface protein transpeptidase)